MTVDPVGGCDGRCAYKVAVFYYLRALHLDAALAPLGLRYDREEHAYVGEAATLKRAAEIVAAAIVAKEKP